MNYRQAKKICRKYTTTNEKLEALHAIYHGHGTHLVFRLRMPVIDHNKMEQAVAVSCRRKLRGTRWERTKRRMDAKIRKRFPWFNPIEKAS